MTDAGRLKGETQLGHVGTFGKIELCYLSVITNCKFLLVRISHTNASSQKMRKPLSMEQRCEHHAPHTELSKTLETNFRWDKLSCGQGTALKASGFPGGCSFVLNDTAQKSRDRFVVMTPLPRNVGVVARGIRSLGEGSNNTTTSLSVLQSGTNG